MSRFLKGSTPVFLMVSFLALGTAVPAQDPMVTKAHEFINLMAQGKYHDAYLKLDSNLGFQLKDSEKLQQMWRNLTAKAGAFKEVRASKTEMISGGGADYVVVTNICKFEKGHVDMKIALDMRGAVADIRYGNHDKPIPGAELPEEKGGGSGDKAKSGDGDSASGGSTAPGQNPDIQS